MRSYFPCSHRISYILIYARHLSGGVTGHHHWEASVLSSSCPPPPPSGIDAQWYDPMGPSLLQDEYSQLSQPFLSGENVESLAKVKVNNIHCSPFIYWAGHLIVESRVGWPWFHFCWSILISPKYLGLFAPSPFLDTGIFVVWPQ